MEFISTFHAYSSGSIDICSCYLRISSSGNLDVSSSGTGSGCSRSPSSSPPPLSPSPFFVKEVLLSSFSGRVCAWLVRWRSEGMSGGNSDNVSLGRSGISCSNNSSCHGSGCGDFDSISIVYGGSDSNFNSCKRFSNRTEIVNRNFTDLTKDLIGSSSSIDSRSGSCGLGKSRSHLPNFITKRIIRPRLCAPAAVVPTEPSASASSGDSPPAESCDNSSNPSTMVIVPGDVEEDGAIGNGMEIRYHRRASYRRKRRHGLEYRPYDICVERISIGGVLAVSAGHSLLRGRNYISIIRLDGDDDAARWAAKDGEIFGEGKTMRVRPVSGAVDRRCPG